MAKRVSVIIPMYNVQDYVEECIASLKDQTLDDFEAICIDDGSTDASYERALNAVDGDSRFTFLKRDHGGPSAARNDGLDLATGDFITFLDADDAYEPYTLERLHRRAIEDDLDLVDFNAVPFYESDEMHEINNEDHYFDRRPIDHVMDGQDLFVTHMAQGSYVPSPCLHFIRRSVFVESGLRFSEGLLHEDELFSPLLYPVCGPSAFLCEPFYLRRVRHKSITSSHDMTNIDYVLRVEQQLLSWLQEHAEEYNTAFIDAYTRNMSYLSFYMFQFVKEQPPEVLDAYLDGLSARDRIDFNLLMRYASLPLDEIHQSLVVEHREFMESKTYRAGQAVTAVPRALRELVRRGR